MWNCGPALPVELDRELPQLLGVDGAGGLSHQIGCFLRFGERDAVADVVEATEKHDKTIDAKRYSTVRRRSVLQCLEQEAKTFLGRGFIDAKQIEDLLLD